MKRYLLGALLGLVFVLGLAVPQAQAAGNPECTNWPLWSHEVKAICARDQFANNTPLTVPIHITTATDTKLVTGTSTQTILVSHWDILTGAADNVTWEYGTGTNCGTGTTNITGTYNFAANGGMVVGNGEAPVFSVPAGNDLCVKTSTTGSADGLLTYKQLTQPIGSP